MLASPPVDQGRWQCGELPTARGVYAARLNPNDIHSEPGRDTAAVDFTSAWRASEQEAIQNLNGAFAATWFTGDGLHLIRDHFGQVPLFWKRIGSAVAFSSVYLDLASISEQSTAVNQRGEALLSGRSWGELGDETPLQGVFRIPPGATTRISPRSHITGKHWQPPEQATTEEMSFSAATEELAVAIDSAVADCLDPGLSTAAHMSGGVDSTLITYLAQAELRAKGERLATAYSWTPLPQEGDSNWRPHESDVVRKLAAAIDVPVWFGPWQPAPGFDERNGLLEPKADLYREHLCVADAQRRGVSVMLSGWGGDDFASFGGRHYAENLFRRGEYRRAIQQILGESRSAGNPTGLALLKLGPVSVRRWRSSRQACRPSIGKLSAVEEARQTRAARYRQASSSRSIMRALHEWGHLSHRIEQWWEEGRRHQLEYRYPLLDLRVVRAAYRMPEPHWARKGLKRAPVKQIISERVNSEWAQTAGKRDRELRDWMRWRSGSAESESRG